MQTLKKQNILGVGVTNEKIANILEYVVDSVQKKDEKYVIVTPNPEILVYATKHKQFRDILNQARIALCDGVGIVIFGKIAHKPFQERVAGVDFMEKLCSEVSEKPVTVGFLGAGPKIAELTAECLVARYPGLKVAFVGEEWSEAGFVQAQKYQVSSSKYTEKKDKNIRDTKYILPNTSVDILFVAYGFPKQEEWIANHLATLPVKVMMAVGGSFDYISGQVPRAPFFFRRLGLEWLYRLIIQPQRWKRQLQLAVFVWLCIKELFVREISD